MKIKGLDFLEQHIEKIILVIVGIVCLWLLLSKVVISPNYVAYDGKKFTPGELDSYIQKQADELKIKLGRASEPRAEYIPQYDSFLAQFSSPIGNLSSKITLPIPPLVKKDIRKSNRKYAVPSIEELQDVSAERIRFVAYVPTEKVSVRNSYRKAKHEPNDIDVVTVEAKLDVSKLYQDFKRVYAGSDVRLEWRDPCLAEPIFAAVDLQRQELSDDGRWGEWEHVPRAQIEAHKDLFKIVEKVDNLPNGGVTVRLLQYNSFSVMKNLLQPEPYKIASPKQEWYPPSLHGKYEQYRKDIEREDRLKEAEKKKKDDELNRQNRMGGMGRTRTKGRGVTGGSALGSLFGQGGAAGRGARTTQGGRFRSNTPGSGQQATGTTQTNQPKKPNIQDIENDFKKQLLTQNSKLSEMSEPLLLWAFDDTVEPKKTYRYQIRLGVFNPLAGTGQFEKDYESYNDDVILWDSFAKVTKPISIPGRMYFFPLSVQEATNSVDIKVSKLVLGYWYSKVFKSMKPGEKIGKVAKTETSSKEGKKEEIKIPEQIDYDTGTVLVDIVPVNEWVGGQNLRQGYYDMLYSYDGTEIKHMPVTSIYWANDARLTYNEILISEKAKREPLRGWNSRSLLRSKSSLTTTGKGGQRKSMMEQLFQQIVEQQQEQSQ